MMLVAVEGPNGAGKSTLVKELADRLSLRLNVLATKEPTDTTFGNAIRHSEGQMVGRSLALAVAADRMLHLETVIRPALATGSLVVTDRYLASSLALQLLDGVSMDDTLALNSQIVKPDLSVFIECSPRTLGDRLESRDTLSRMESSYSRVEETSAFRSAFSFLNALGWNQIWISADRVSVSEMGDRVIGVINDLAGNKAR